MLNFKSPVFYGALGLTAAAIVVITYLSGQVQDARKELGKSEQSNADLRAELDAYGVEQNRLQNEIRRREESEKRRRDEVSELRRHMDSLRARLEDLKNNSNEDDGDQTDENEVCNFYNNPVPSGVLDLMRESAARANGDLPDESDTPRK